MIRHRVRFPATIEPPVQREVIRAAHGGALTARIGDGA